MTASDGLFLFTRYPQPGKTKTRLIPALGEVGAADLQRQMTEHLFHRVQSICTQRDIQLQVHFTGGSLQQMQDWLGEQVLLVPQHKGDLGDRLIAAFHQGFTTQLQRIVIIGSDCPEVNDTHIVRSLSLLNTHDVVLGPATDGGYYLIGLRALQTQLFKSVPWSTEQLLSTTQSIAASLNLSVALLDWLSDIDRPEDLALWEKAVPSWRFDK